MKVQLSNRSIFTRRSILIRAGLSLAFSLCATVPALAGEFSGPVIRVSDGDTITVLHDGRPERIRLNGIDCPEKRQAFGARAKQMTSTLTSGQTVRVVTSTTDKYGRTVGEVILPDGRSLNQELVAGGMAWQYRKYSQDPSLAAAEAQARSEGAGLWADPAPIAPWNYRAMVKVPTPRPAGVNVLTGHRRSPSTSTYRAVKRWKRYLSRYSY